MQEIISVIIILIAIASGVLSICIPLRMAIESISAREQHLKERREELERRKEALAEMVAANDRMRKKLRGYK